LESWRRGDLLAAALFQLGRRYFLSANYSFK
jgi:hypothetical protein